MRKDTFAEQEKKIKCLGYSKLEPIKELDKSKLPLNKQVLECFFSLQNSQLIQEHRKLNPEQSKINFSNKNYISYIYLIIFTSYFLSFVESKAPSLLLVLS